MKFASAILLLALTLPANAQGSTITLSCNGTGKFTATTADRKPDPITNLGIIVNADKRTVTFMDYVIPIKSITDTQVFFSVSGAKESPLHPTINGTIDRVTGNTGVEWWYENVGNNTSWELTCLPTKRLF